MSASELHAYSAHYSLTAKPGCSGFERAIFESRPSAWPNPSLGAAAVSSPQLRDGQQLGDRARVAACCRRCGSRRALARGATTIEPSTASSWNDDDAILEKETSCLFEAIVPPRTPPQKSSCVRSFFLSFPLASVQAQWNRARRGVPMSEFPETDRANQHPNYSPETVAKATRRQGRAFGCVGTK